ncbi:hypothetical protein AGABI1DRAFT_111428 [Agaricus bisporus var. burnettii JB137-S8]|uniref:Nucleotide exchange factor Fes1 domain-containing protein n=1 Tax=Agaricus bisporus var. burnettii (strain JB137-S8 / ATCC MYA-4627 / FGSC 10392) TaxID=597362 RepID=K5W7N3_AGABU|nr:uncharacterized protein AGABI1DRAFT_111428 [Agaricus bisporus var. burnettii JB137-S8]EKM82864.1 hypothetical protein AGABI1DRAFT_111428 [Agaricus bisporus var. burnettii JB137-S8]
MQSLLRWSLENSSPQDGSSSGDGAVASRRELDPGIIDMILGKPDAVQLKEDVSVAVDAERSEDDRLAALDHMEMLVENIDNANDLKKLDLWQPLLSLLDSTSSSTEIKVQVLWVLGTALQNNPAAQDVYLAYKPLPTLLGFLTPSPSTTVATRSKALYTLSGLLKHNAPAVKELDNPESGGWVQLRGALQDPEISVRRKTAFLLNSLILPTNPNPVAAQQSTPRSIAPPTNATTDSIPSATVESASIIGPTTSMSTMSTTPAESHSAGDSQNGPVHPNSHDAYLKDPSRTDTSTASLEAFDRYNIVGAVISSVVDPVPFGQDGENDKSDADYEEKAMHLLHAYAVQCGRSFVDEDKRTLRQWIEKEAAADSHVAERWNFSLSDLDSLRRRLS